MPDHCELALHIGKQCMLGAAAQHLAQEGSAGLQHFTGEFESCFAQGHDAQMVRLPVAGGMRRHIGENDIGLLAAERLLERLRRTGGKKVLLQHGHTRNGIHAMLVDGDDLAIPLLREEQIPGAGRGCRWWPG